MPTSGSSSFLANSDKRKQGLSKVRQRLLDRPGIPRRGGPPPPTVPAQNRTSPQEQAVGQTRTEQRPQQQPQRRVTAPAGPEEQTKPTLNLDDNTRQEFLGQIDVFLGQVRREKRARLHSKIGRTRRFFGSGL